jgi:hypothetical protein
MTDDRSPIIRAAFCEQAGLCQSVGSPFTAELLETLSKTLDETTQTGRTILRWPGDPMVDALALRITGGLHALARSGDDAALTALYAEQSGDMPAILSRVLADWDTRLLPWLDSAPQTNEVGRSGMLWPGMMEIARRFGPRLELLELGASAGLNLNMDHYGYDLGGVRAGKAGSSVQLAPEWTGPPPLAADVEIVRKSGVDLNPLDVSQGDVAALLLAYVWPDQPTRLKRIAAAIDLSQTHRPQVDRGDGAVWIETALAAPQEMGVTRVVYHSIALQYFPEAGRKRVITAIHDAGEAATPERPLAWLSMEFSAEVKAYAMLRLQCWPGSGKMETLAELHPHGAKIKWLG